MYSWAWGSQGNAIHRTEVMARGIMLKPSRPWVHIMFHGSA